MTLEKKMKIVINNYFEKECSVNTSIREAFEKGFRIGVSKGQTNHNADVSKMEIIRCKECKHHWVYKCMDSMPRETCDLNQTFYDAEVDFCSLAERRGEAGHT